MAQMMTKMRLALDAHTARRYDTNGFLHIEGYHIAKEKVYPYTGDELPEVYGLDPDCVYYAYLPASVLRSAALSFEGVPLLLDHHDESAEFPAKEYRVGSLGNVHYSAPYLDADLHVTDRQAIEGIEDDTHRELSIGFFADYVNKPGRFRGEDYNFTITRLRGNHVALVPEGRAGHDCLVADAASVPFLTWYRAHGFGKNEMTK